MRIRCSGRLEKLHRKIRTIGSFFVELKAAETCKPVTPKIFKDQALASFSKKIGNSEVMRVAKISELCLLRYFYKNGEYSGNRFWRGKGSFSPKKGNTMFHEVVL